MPVPETPGVLSVAFSHGSKAHRERDHEPNCSIAPLPSNTAHPMAFTEGAGWEFHWRSGGSGRGQASSAKSRATGILNTDRNRSKVISVIPFSVINASASDFLGCSCVHQEGRKSDLVFCLFNCFLAERLLFFLSPAVIHGVEGDIKGTQSRKLWFPFLLGLLA